MHNPSLWLLIKINLGGFIKREKGSKGAHLSESSHEEGLPGTHCATPITALPSFSTSTHSYSNHCATQHSQTLPTTLQSEPLQTLHDPNPDLCFSLDDYCDFGPNFFYPNGAKLQAESTEEQLEPLFDYHRFQPFDVVCLDGLSSLSYMPIVDDVRACPNLVESSSGSHDLQMHKWAQGHCSWVLITVPITTLKQPLQPCVLSHKCQSNSATSDDDILLFFASAIDGLTLTKDATLTYKAEALELQRQLRQLQTHPQCSGTFQDIANSAARQKEIMVLLKIYWGDASGKICEAIDNIPLSCLVIGNRGVGKLKRWEFLIYTHNSRFV
ncbi:hypothetical protein TEA_007061 [Camellia sinensis var. sinensis]|uniref:UspA domain-containing protein n=1 Tax=Camellia sinensis var. sinensis TaxID=542762 RepID=A0A4S4CY87_CAMSN|nr:hypothetical protein TEA_007061 [Camellia sinensis var. sinensis]